MNKDELEEFVAKNREEFEFVEKPGLSQVWTDIQNAQINKSSTTPDYSKLLYLIIGLLALAIIMLGVIIFKNNSNDNAIQQFVNQSPELMQEQETWLHYVQEKEREVSTEVFKKEDYTEIYEELDELEKMQETLIYDFDLEGDKEKIVRILFRKYERRSKILEQLLAEIKKNKIHENSDPTTIY